MFYELGILSKQKKIDLGVIDKQSLQNIGILAKQNAKDLGIMIKPEKIMYILITEDNYKITTEDNAYLLII